MTVPNTEWELYLEGAFGRLQLTPFMRHEAAGQVLGRSSNRVMHKGPNPS